MRSLQTDEVRVMAAMIFASGSIIVISIRFTSIKFSVVIAFSTFEKTYAIHSQRAPAGIRVAHFIISELIVHLRVRLRLLLSSDLKELEHTSSAKFDVLCASVIN